MQEKVFQTFRLGGYHIAIPTNDYQKIIEYDMFKIHEPLPFLVKCLFNDGNDTFPIIDTRLKFGMKNFNKEEGSCIIVDKYFVSGSNTFKLGLLMNSYTGEFTIPKKNIVMWQQGWIPEFGDLIKGVCRVNEKEHLIITMEDTFPRKELKEFYHLYQDYMIKDSYIPVYRKFDYFSNPYRKSFSNESYYDLHSLINKIEI